MFQKHVRFLLFKIIDNIVVDRDFNKDDYFLMLEYSQVSTQVVITKVCSRKCRD